jgi:large conductance mechanosensitive channel
MLKGFKDFLMRGNVVDLAVAVAIGAAFGAVVKGLLDGLLTPLVAAVAGQADLKNVGKFEWNNAHFSIGVFLDAVVNFVIVAAAIYFIVVLPLNKLAERRSKGAEPATDSPSEEVALLTEIRDSLRVRS